MKKTTPLIPLVQRFIKESETGKRLKKNGTRIRKGTIDNYRYLLNNLIGFSLETSTELRICDASKLTKREVVSEKNYWKRFYLKFTGYLYKNGCHDNYVGANIKLLRSIFNYLRDEKNMAVGNFHKAFYVRKEEVEIMVLSPERLKLLIHDNDLQASLTPMEQRVKDIFVFGCTTSLRFSDIFKLTNKNFEQQNGEWYLKVKSQKTNRYSAIKLPAYAVDIYQKYRPKKHRASLFASLSLNNFNIHLKRIGEKAGFTEPYERIRERRGNGKRVQKTRQGQEKNRFCDYMSSHMMRRTAITTLLILGMPEHLVRSVSGHTSNSKSFYRYVNFAQAYVDQEINKVHEKLAAY